MMMLSKPRRVTLGVALVTTLLVGCSSGGKGESVAAPDDSDAVVVGTDSFVFEPDEFAIPAGGATIALQCERSLPHDIVIEGASSDETVVECAGGQTATGDVDLEPGTYTFFCSIPGHRSAGMEGTIAVG